MCIKVLRPGERKILQSLKEGEKRFTELHEETGLQYNILSKYLKNLQKGGLVVRDIDTRGYRSLKRGWETLYLVDIHDLIEEYGIRRENVKLWGLSVFVSGDADALNHMDRALTGGEPCAEDVYPAFSRINRFLFDVWKERALTFFNEEEREVITGYERALQEAVWLATPPEERVDEGNLKLRAEEKLKRRYPGVEPPEELVRLEVERDLKRLRARAPLTADIRDVKKLKKYLSRAHHLTEEGLAELKPLMEYLEDPENVKVHEGFLEKMRGCPKTLIIFTSAGFGGYLEAFWQFFPDEKETFKKKHPWLYARIKESFAHV